MPSSPSVDRRSRPTPALIGLVVLGSLLTAGTAGAQVASTGRGVLTLEVGRGTAPVGAIADALANPGSDVPQSDTHANAFRLLAGYHFSEYFSVMAGVSHMGTLKSRAAYAQGDTLRADTSLNVLEADLVGHLPFASRGRVDFSAGLTETALHTTVSTAAGSALPVGEDGDQNVRRLGATAGLDVEWRLTDITSLLLGYHVYPRVGSSKLRDSASGSPGMLLAGVQFEF